MSKLLLQLFGLLPIFFVFIVSACSPTCNEGVRIITSDDSAKFCEVSSVENSPIYAKNLFVIAMPEESAYIVNRYGLKRRGENLYSNRNMALIVTGIGGKNVEQTLAKYSVGRNVCVFNFGYCGSNNLQKGSVVKIDKVAKVENRCAVKILTGSGEVNCFSADKFVESTDIKTPCVFDMELAYIAKMYPQVVSYKIVSDNLSRSEYEKFDADESWKIIFDRIDRELGLGDNSGK